jgi:hypothetical protein
MYIYTPNHYSSFTINRCIFTNCKASLGGVLFLEENIPYIFLTHTRFENNDANDGDDICAYTLPCFNDVKSGSFDSSVCSTNTFVCFPGLEPTEERNDCVECEIGTYSNPTEGVLCTTCGLIDDLDLCGSVRGPSSEECFWIGSNESESEGHCVDKVLYTPTIFFKSYFSLFVLKIYFFFNYLYC